MPAFLLNIFTRSCGLKRHGPCWLLVLAAILPCALIPSPLKAQATPPPEISAHDAEPDFKLQVERNVVTVRVVVRDSKGAVVDNLRQEDFKIFDHGKPQAISNFSLERPALKATAPTPAKPAEKPEAEPDASDETVTPATTARHFVALFFDNVNTPFENLARTRDAAEHFLTSSVQPGDRVALFTSSGQKQVDFTRDVAKLRQALGEIRSRPIVPEKTSCEDIPAYQAYLIVERHDPTATAVATDQIAQCECPANPSQCLSRAQLQLDVVAERSLAFSDTQATSALRGIESVVSRLTSLPGQRSMVIVSSGFLIDTLLFQLDAITERALRGGVVVNAIDARGLYTDPVVSNIEAPTLENLQPRVFAIKAEMIREGVRRQSEVMRYLAHDTGGIFFENSNDLNAGFRKVGAAPETYYLLAFSPQNLKHDGAFHELKVTLASPRGLTVQARRGYFAPKKTEDLASQEKEEIREAVFSKEEAHTLPLDVHTQFFKKSQFDAQITVLTRLDIHPVQLHKEADRNVGKLTFVTVLFDQDGNVVDAQKRLLDLNMRDATLARYLETGLSIKNVFSVKPGTYQVREVICDSGSGQISGLNRTVEIPY